MRELVKNLWLDYVFDLGNITAKFHKTVAKLEAAAIHHHRKSNRMDEAAAKAAIARDAAAREKAKAERLAAKFKELVT